MNTFIENNKQFFKFYYAALRLSGWLLLILGFCSTGITMLLARMFRPEVFAIAVINMPLIPLDFILFGLLGLGIAQLIRYLFDSDLKPGIILLHGSKFLYAYVILILIMLAIRNIYTIKYMMDRDINNSQSLLVVTSIASIVLFAAKALILIGIAQFLKRITPIIEEHKSLI